MLAIVEGRANFARFLKFPHGPRRLPAQSGSPIIAGRLSLGFEVMSRKERRHQQRLLAKAGRAAQAESAAVPAGPAAPAAAVAALQQQAMALHQLGRPRLALEACRALLARQPHRPDVLSFAGMIAFEIGEFAESASLYRRALALKPDFVEAQYNLANALQALGRLEEAGAAYRRALELKPDLVPAHHNLGSVLQSLARPEEAAQSYRRALALRPSAESERNLGAVLEQLGALDEAIAAFRRALTLRPGWADASSNLVHALFARRALKAAVEACETWLGLSPGSVQATALLALALNELCDRARARALLDFDRLVQVIDFPTAPGYGSVAELNAALVRHVETHPTLKVPPADDPTYHHPALQITEELLVEPKGPMADLERLMHEAIARYLASVPRDPPHPFLAHFPKRWALRAWATRLAGQGNLVPHIHLDGYLGGVYYPLLPEVVREPGHGEAGWFELGRPPAALGAEAEPIVRRIQPLEGRMLLFPGYFFHNTVPFASAERRISIAFDLVPEPAAG
jgi:tetratricopeptide (TPR) repeat protein